MPRILALLLLVGLGAAYITDCGNSGPGPPDHHSEVRRLDAQNRELRQQNQELTGLHQQAMTELKAARQTADQADTALRTSYLAFAPLTGTLAVLGAGMAAMVVIALRRRRCPK